MNTFNNVQGDELVARLWVKNLLQDKRVTSVDLNGTSNYDVSINFTPMLPSTGGLKVLYLQNIFPKPNFIGTEETFHQVKNNYDAFMFPSEGLRDKCDKDGLVSYFATDPDIFNKKEFNKKLNHKACFVGNNIRDPETTERYLLCAKNNGLIIYGSLFGWKSHPNCAGFISVQNESILYSSAKTCLNVHVKEHLEYGCPNFRIFNILACGGFIISDKSNFLEKEFSDSIVFTDGYDDLNKLIDYYSENQEKTITFRENGYKKVLEKHTFKNRVNELLNWLKDKV